MKNIFQYIFGAKAQVVIGTATFILGIISWLLVEFIYSSQLSEDPLVGAIFRVSMFFGLVACYSIIATGLGYKATERVETAVVENIANVEEVNADTVNVEQKD